MEDGAVSVRGAPRLATSLSSRLPLSPCDSHATGIAITTGAAIVVVVVVVCIT